MAPSAKKPAAKKPAAKKRRVLVHPSGPPANLTDAVRAADLDAIRRLAAAGAPLNLAPGAGYAEAPLDAAVSAAGVDALGGSDAMVPVVELLIELGADVTLATPLLNQPPLWTAAYTGVDPLARLFVARGSVITGTHGPDRYTIVHAASIGGLDWLVERALAAGVEADAATAQNHRAMHFVFGEPATPRRPWRAIAERLARAGAAVAPNNAGWGTPLHWAAARAGDEPVRWLVAQGAPVDVVDAGGTGYTPLLSAASSRHACADACVAALLELGADARFVAQCGVTALHLAAYAGNAAVIERLVRAGADKKLATTGSVMLGSSPIKAGARPADFAKRAKHTEVAALLA